METSVKHSPTEDFTTCHVSNREKHPNKSVYTLNLAEKLPTLCYNCHERFNKTNIHPPVESGNCKYCHNHHYSTQIELLKNTYSKQGFSPINSECFKQKNRISEVF